MNRDEMLAAPRGAETRLGRPRHRRRRDRARASPSTRRRAATARCCSSRHDFAKGTSSRSTKLVHGGVRYLEQGNFSLVIEALRERGLLYRNAPHLVHNLAFVVPRYHWWEGPFYGIGLKLYDVLAGKLNLAPSRVLDREETIARDPERRAARTCVGGIDVPRRPVRRRAPGDHPRARPPPTTAPCCSTTCAVAGLAQRRDGLRRGRGARDAETGALRRDPRERRRQRDRHLLRRRAPARRSRRRAADRAEPGHPPRARRARSSPAHDAPSWCRRPTTAACCS